MARKNSKITVLNNEYYRQQTSAADQQEHKQAAKKKHRWHMQLLLIIAVVVTVGCSIQIVKNELQTRQITTQTTSAKKELNDQREQHQQLELQVKQLNDPDYLQKYIRERYYYSKKNETIYNLPEERLQDAAREN